MLNYLIINGQYPDFSSGKMKEGNIGILDGKIVEILPWSEQKPASKTIDARGKIVSPGFLDIHMHEEDFIKEGKKYCIADRMLHMGVTTCVAGNCGVQEQNLAYFKEVISELGGAPVNYIMLAGYNTYREKLGIGRYEKASEEQKKLLMGNMREELKEGAYGISFGIEYDPGIETEEILSVLSAFPDENLLVSIHFRADMERAIASIQEIIDIAKVSGKKLQISHLSSCAALGQMKEAIQLINKEMDQNPKLSYDTYPYNAFSTSIGSAVFDVDWVQKWSTDYKNILLLEDPYKNQYCDKELFEKARKEYPEMNVVAFVMKDEEIGLAIANEKGMIGSDGGCSYGTGHPRGAGTFPRILGKYVREEKWISLIDALKKMTLAPALRLGLENEKGQIQIGGDADLVIFDPEEIRDCATYTNMNINPKGVEYVFVDGRVAIEKEKEINLRLGKFIPYHS